MQDLNDLYYFSLVAEHGGFAAASRASGIPKSKLSRRIAALESRLGTRLFQRSTRQFSVTVIGEEYQKHCRAMLVEAEAAQEAIDSLRAEPRGIVRMTCPVDLLQTTVSEMLSDFLARYPQVDIQLEASNRRVDPVAEGIDLAMRVRTPPLDDSELFLRVLATREPYLVASQTFLDRHPALQNPSDLVGLPSLDMIQPNQDHRWKLIGPSGKSAEIKHQPRLVTDNMVALRHAAIAGLGIVKLPSLMIQNELIDCALKPVLPEWRNPAVVTHLVYPSRRGQLPSVRALIEFLAQKFALLDEKNPF